MGAGVTSSGSSAAELVTAYGTALAAVATLLAVVVALWQSRRAQAQAQEAHKLALTALELARAEREDAEARQARQVTSRVGNGSPASAVHVNNTSAEPIGAVRIEAVHLDDMVAPETWTYALGPGHATPMLNAGAALTTWVEFRDADGELLPIEQTRGATADVSFVDSRGVRWQRWGLVQPRKANSAAVHRAPMAGPQTHRYSGPGSLPDRV